MSISVRLARADEASTAAAVLTDAFENEAGLNFWLRQGPTKDRVRRRFFNAVVGDVLHAKREIWLAEENGRALGAAVWLPPGAVAFDLQGWNQLAVTPLLFQIAGLGGMGRALALGKMLEERHPKVRHAHLVFLGVATAAQGQGVGSALLKQTLAPVDATRLAAVLETTTERNVALYQRHGFETTSQFALHGTQFWTMLRAAR